MTATVDKNEAGAADHEKGHQRASAATRTELPNIDVDTNTRAILRHLIINGVTSEDELRQYTSEGNALKSLATLAKMRLAMKCGDCMWTYAEHVAEEAA
jgi:hypothetical protein